MKFITIDFNQFIPQIDRKQCISLNHHVLILIRKKLFRSLIQIKLHQRKRNGMVFCMTRAHTGACIRLSFFTLLHFVQTRSHSLWKRMPKNGKNRTLIKLNQLQLNDGIQIKCLADPCQLIENVFASHLDVDFLLHAISNTRAHTHTHIWNENSWRNACGHH